MAPIELDLTAQPDHPPTSLPPVHRYRTAGLVLAALLVVALGGAAAPGALRWAYLGAVGWPPFPESSFQLDGDLVITLGASGNDRVVSAWTVAKPPVRRWRRSLTDQGLAPHQVRSGNLQAHLAGSVVLITEGLRTTVVDARTGATRWRTDVPMHPLAGDRIGLVQEPKFRPGTDYDEASAAAGEVFLSNTGVPHTEPPTETDLHGVDLRTGATVWSVTAAGAVATYDGDAGLLVLESNRLTRHAIDTGAVLGTTTLPPVGGQAPESVRLVGDLALISYGAGDSTARSLVAYSVRTLRPLWRVPQAPVLARPSACLGLVCADDPSGVSVLDPATGRARWHVAGVDLSRYGTEVLEQETETSDPVRLADPRTGDERLRLAGWHADLDSAAGAPLVLRRTGRLGASEFALIDDPPLLKPLGASRGPVSDCAVNDRYLVCRGPGVLQVFAFRN